MVERNSLGFCDTYHYNFDVYVRDLILGAPVNPES